MITGFHVAIRGGCMAGPMLAALLRRETALRVALFDQERRPFGVWPSRAAGGEPLFPGDAFIPSSRATTSLACDPSASMVVDRFELEQILLQRARSDGATIFEGTSIEALQPVEEGWVITLDGGHRIRGAIFVDASDDGARARTGDEAFCDYDQRWMRVEHNPFLGGPLLSAEVISAAARASAAAIALGGRFDPSFSEQERRELWVDYAVVSSEL